MTPATLRLRTDSVEWRHVEDEIVALTSRDDRYLGVNRTGALLWRALADGSDLDGLASILEAEGASAEQARADATSFVDLLRERELLEG